LSFVSTTMPMGNNFPKTVKLNSMNIASKITSLTGANKISIGENVYKSLDHKTQREFHELSMPDNRWKYINYGTDRPYKVYTLNT
jgi:adenylate cyclase